MQIKIDPGADSRAYQEELAALRSNERLAGWFKDCAEAARRLPGGFVKKIVWENSGARPGTGFGL